MHKTFYKRPIHTALMATAALFLATACSTVDETSLSGAKNGTAQVDFRVSTAPSPNEVYEAREAFTVPSNHKVGDKIYPYEGVGWENEIVGYRLYLDERAVTDIFGKRTPDMVLQTVDYRSNYHDMANWGMDVLKVGPSMGVGGLGLYRNAALERFGASGEISVQVNQARGTEAAFTVTHSDVPFGDGQSGNVSARYTINSGSPLTWVKVESDLPSATLATGLVAAANSKRIRNTNAVKKGEWRYIASWGDKRSEVKDGLGMVLFYRDGDARLMPKENETFALRFNTSNPEYIFAGVWEQGPMGITNAQEFIAWADQQQAALNK